MINYRSKENAPCHKCTERYGGCHAECKLYEDWKEELKEDKDMFWKAEGGNCAHKNLMSEHKYKNIKAKVKKRG